MSEVHFIKKIQFLNQRIGICLQNKNGPCPLLALVNVLLLRGTVKLPEDMETITTQDLISVVGNYILESNPATGSDAENATLAKTIQDVIDILPSMMNGLDINVNFSGIDRFEFDARISVFDLLGINLFHGWAVDIHDEELYKAVGDMTYNKLMDRMIDLNECAEGGAKYSKRTSADMAAAYGKIELIQRFLADSAAQLTLAGFVQLHERVGERQLCVFFRNNHFSTMFKLDGKLYMLVTDQGYIHDNSVAWELLNDITGDTDLVSPAFNSPSEFVAQKLQDQETIRAQQQQQQQQGGAGQASNSSNKNCTVM